MHLLVLMDYATGLMTDLVVGPWKTREANGAEPGSFKHKRGRRLARDQRNGGRSAA
jgi:hypothetical protein